MSTCSGIGYSRLSMAFSRVDLPHPFSPSSPYLRPKLSSKVVSVMRTFPWKTSEADVILTSLLVASEDKTPVVTRSLRPCLSSCSVNFCTFVIFSLVVAGWSSSSSSSKGGVSSPLTEEACEPLTDAFLELCFDANFEAAVFFLSPSARLAWRAAFEAETGIFLVALWKSGSGVGGRCLRNIPLKPKPCRFSRHNLQGRAGKLEKCMGENSLNYGQSPEMTGLQAWDGNAMAGGLWP